MDPDFVRDSNKDSTVHLYYFGLEQDHICVVVGGSDVGDHFVITAYITKGIKKGEELWKK